MTARVHITHLFSPKLKLLIRRGRGGVTVTDWTGEERKVTQKEANAIALAVLEGTGLPATSEASE